MKSDIYFESFDLDYKQILKRLIATGCAPCCNCSRQDDCDNHSKECKAYLLWRKLYLRNGY